MTFNVNAIPEWQKPLYEKLGIPYSTQLLMRTVNQLECGDENGFCLGLNASDAGPFQINRIHKAEYAESVRLVKAGKAAWEISMRTGDWKETVRIRDKLFLYQAAWTYERMKRLAKAYGWKVNYENLPREKQVWYQAVWHNGNTKMKNGRQFRYYYGDKAVKHWKVLSQKGKPSAAVAKAPAPLASKPLRKEPTETFEAPAFPELETLEAFDLPDTEGFYLPSL